MGGAGGSGSPRGCGGIRAEGFLPSNDASLRPRRRFYVPVLDLVPVLKFCFTVDVDIVTLVV